MSILSLGLVVVANGRLRTLTHPSCPPTNGLVMEDRLAWIDLDIPEQLANRREHLIKLEAQLPTTTHPIDLENLQMAIGSTQAVIVFNEKFMELFPEKFK